MEDASMNTTTSDGAGPLSTSNKTLWDTVQDAADAGRRAVINELNKKVYSTIGSIPSFLAPCDQFPVRTDVLSSDSTLRYRTLTWNVAQSKLYKHASKEHAYPTFMRKTSPKKTNTDHPRRHPFVLHDVKDALRMVILNTLGDIEHTGKVFVEDENNVRMYSVLPVTVTPEPSLVLVFRVEGNGTILGKPLLISNAQTLTESETNNLLRRKVPIIFGFSLKDAQTYDVQMFRVIASEKIKQPTFHANRQLSEKGEEAFSTFSGRQEINDLQERGYDAAQTVFAILGLLLNDSNMIATLQEVPLTEEKKSDSPVLLEKKEFTHHPFLCLLEKQFGARFHISATCPGGAAKALVTLISKEFSIENKGDDVTDKFMHDICIMEDVVFGIFDHVHAWMRCKCHFEQSKKTLIVACVHTPPSYTGEMMATPPRTLYIKKFNDWMEGRLPENIRKNAGIITVLKNAHFRHAHGSHYDEHWSVYDVEKQLQPYYSTKMPKIPADSRVLRLPEPPATYPQKNNKLLQLQDGSIIHRTFYKYDGVSATKNYTAADKRISHTTGLNFAHEIMKDHVATPVFGDACLPALHDATIILLGDFDYSVTPKEIVVCESVMLRRAGNADAAVGCCVEKLDPIHWNEWDEYVLLELLKQQNDQKSTNVERMNVFNRFDASHAAYLLAQLNRKPEQAWALRPERMNSVLKKIGFRASGRVFSNVSSDHIQLAEGQNHALQRIHTYFLT
tara:strand:- start:1510 stop:3702 length:2193 start_codon:yes stop_codon:yes gene_type:complete